MAKQQAEASNPAAEKLKALQTTLERLDKTYGKGTVQSSIDLNKLVNPSMLQRVAGLISKDKTVGTSPSGASPADINLGQINLTMAKFYRVSGNSTQHKGVIPDVNFPSIYPLDKIGEDGVKKEMIEKGISEEALVKVQHDSGAWYQILDKPNAPGNYLESSASGMFTYFFAKGVNNGYLDARYKATAVKAYEGLVNEFILVHPDNTISLINTVQVAGLGFGRDGSYHYYMSEPIFRNDAKANGPFIMAAAQMATLLGYPTPVQR